jgi:hypothetical protein
MCFSLFWEVIVPAGLGLIGAYVITKEEREARERWERKRKQVERSVQDHRREIELHLQEAKQSYDYKLLTSMHHSSVIVADEAYKLLQDARTTLASIGKMIVTAKEKRAELQKNLKTTIKDKTPKGKIKEELKIVAELRRELFSERDKEKKDYDHFYSEVKRLNAQSAELKCIIRDRCGYKGVDWYKRLEERKRLKKLAATYPINDGTKTDSRKVNPATMLT